MTLRLPASRFDISCARAIERWVGPGTERLLGVVTWAADEKVLLAAAALAWPIVRRRGSTRLARRADAAALAMLVAVILPHGIKRVVDRTRPDRILVGPRRHGIPRSGNARDSFPSGHALHLGVLASTLSALVPGRWRPAVWGGAALLAGSRLGLLAHYPTDVAAGLGLGVVLDRTAARLLDGAGARWR